MKRILCSLIVATLPFGSALADAKSKNVKVTLVYQHELPNVPGKSIKGVLVEYGLGGYSPGHTHPKSAFIYATVLEGAIRSQVNDGPVTTYFRPAEIGLHDLVGSKNCRSTPMAAAFPICIPACTAFMRCRRACASCAASISSTAPEIG
jgi:hypothetical protein